LSAVDGFSQLNSDAVKLIDEHFHQTVNADLLPSLVSFNYEEVDPENRRAVIEGYALMKHASEFNTKQPIELGYKLDESTKLYQIARLPFMMLVRLKATPKTMESYQRAFKDMVAHMLPKTGSGLKKFTTTNHTNMHEQYPAYEAFLNIISNVQSQLIDNMKWAQKNYTAYENRVNPVYEGKYGLKELLRHLFTIHDATFLVQYMESTDHEGQKGRSMATLKSRHSSRKGQPVHGDAPVYEPTKAMAESLQEEIQFIFVFLQGIRKVSKQVFEDQKSREITNFTLGGPAKLLHAYDFEADPGKEHVSVDNTHFCRECGTGDYSYDTDQGYSAELAATDSTDYQSRPPPRANQKVYDSNQRQPLKGQDFNDVCFHLLLGTQCHGGCLGRLNHDLFDAWKAARYLLNQTKENLDKGHDRDRKLVQSMKELEVKMRAAGISYPAYTPPARNSESSGKPRRVPPPAPTRQGSGGVSRNDQILKKHQFSPQLNALDDSEYERYMEAVMSDRRFSMFYAIENDTALPLADTTSSKSVDFEEEM
jgi:hypothetical protein